MKGNSMQSFCNKIDIFLGIQKFLSCAMPVSSVPSLWMSIGSVAGFGCMNCVWVLVWTAEKLCATILIEKSSKIYILDLFFGKTSILNKYPA